MRIGIVSDIHGNAAGLSAALDLMGDVDELLCAGDMVEEYRFNNETIELLRERGARCVQGNHDIGILKPHGQRAREAEHVNPALVRYLADQPLTIEAVVDGKRLLMTHASPCAPGTQYVGRSSPELKRLSTIDADFIVIGHTHMQMVERVGSALVINPGSAGRARDHFNQKRLSFAVLDTSTEEVLIHSFGPRRVS